MASSNNRSPDVQEQLRYLHFCRNQLTQAIESLQRFQQIRGSRKATSDVVSDEAPAPVSHPGSAKPPQSGSMGRRQRAGRNHG